MQTSPLIISQKINQKYVPPVARTTSIRRRTAAAAERFFGEAGAIVCFLVEVGTSKKNERAEFGEVWRKSYTYCTKKNITTRQSTGFSYSINKYMVLSVGGFSYPMNLGSSVSMAITVILTALK